MRSVGEQQPLATTARLPKDRQGSSDCWAVCQPPFSILQALKNKKEEEEEEKEEGDGGEEGEVKKKKKSFPSWVQIALNR